MFLYTDASFLIVIEDSPWPTFYIAGSDERVMPKRFCKYVIGIMTFRKDFFDYIFVRKRCSACLCVCRPVCV